jgi:uncharacterized protein YhbP (UPF0306 family)
MAEFEWSKYLKECLESTSFMALATQGTGGLWNHAVYFAYDSKLNVYFMSQPGSRHMQNLTLDGGVAVAIFATDQDATKNAVGIQIRGEATILAGEQVAQAHAIYYQRAPVINGIPSQLSEFLAPAALWRLVKVEPQEIGYFNSQVFGEHRQTVPAGTTL